MTRKQLCELILIRLAGGDPSDDFPVTLSEINLWLDPAVAASARQNYIEAVQVDGIEFVGDAYYTTFKNIALTADPGTPYYSGTLPAMPVGLPRGYDVSAAYLQTGLTLGPTLVRVNPQQLAFWEKLPRPQGVEAYWVEGNRVFVQGYNNTNYAGRQVTIRMVGSAGRRELTDELLIPMDYIPFVVDYIQKNFLPTQTGPKDLMNDGNDIRVNA